MQVTAEQTYIAPSGDRRGRICRRGDGRFQIVTERLRPADDEHESYWINDYPPSGLFGDRDKARLHLLGLLPGATEVHCLEPSTFQLDVGPYPEPRQRTSD